MVHDVTELKRRRGIYLLPNLFTTAGLFAGFYAIVAANNDHFVAAAVSIFIAMIMDGLDGRVARMTHTQSDFGAEYDSLSDVISFGLAPALVMYEWALASLAGLGWTWAKLGWLAAFLYTAATALRLARFNTQLGVVDRRYFRGLPSPAAAAVLAGLVWVGADLGSSGTAWRVPAFLLTVTVAALMVSNIRYHSFKEIDLAHRVPFVALLAVVLVFVFTSIDPPKILFTASLVYAGSGPVLAFLAWRKRGYRRAAQTPPLDRTGSDD